MAFNLVDLIQKQLGSQLTDQISNVLDADTTQTKTALSGAVPALLGSLLNSSQEKKGADALASALDSQDSGLLNNIGGMLSGGNHQSLMDMGGNLLSSLFGENKLSGLIGAISSFSGLGRSSAGSLLGLLMPVIMGVLGRQKRDLGLDSTGISKLLSDQKDNIVGAMPEGLTKALNQSGMMKDLMGDISSNVTAAQTRVANMAGEGIEALQDAAKPRKSILTKIIPLIIILIIAWIVWRYLIGGGMMDTAQNAADNVTQVASSAADALKDTVVGDINVGEGIRGIFSGATDVLNSVKDAESAQAAVAKFNELGTQAGELGGLVGEMPAAGKSAIAQLISDNLPALQALLDKILALPGVGDLLKPAADALLEKLSQLQT